MIRVASFNVRNLNSAVEKDSRKSRDIKRMADLVKDCDIVVLQEVIAENMINVSSNVGAERSLTRELGLHWEGKWVDSQTHSKKNPYLGEDRRGEGYAFLWNTQRVELIKENDRVIYPRRYGDYMLAPDTEQIRLRRDPGYGRFKLKTRPVEIRVINVHIISNKPDQANMTVDVDGGAITMRKLEFDVLAGRIFKKIDDDRLSERNNAVYTLIMGDFNLNLQGSELTTATIPAVSCYDNFGRPCVLGTTQMKTIQKERTTINKERDGYANNYDHCTYNTRSEHVIGNCYRIQAIDDDTPEAFKEYYETVSDHLPIVVELNC